MLTSGPRLRARIWPGHSFTISCAVMKLHVLRVCLCVLLWSLWGITVPFLSEDLWLSSLGLFREAQLLKSWKFQRLLRGEQCEKSALSIHMDLYLLTRQGLCDELNGVSQFCYGLICCTITTQSKTFSRMCKLGYCKNRGPLYQGLPMGPSFSHKVIALVQKGRTVPCPLPWKKKDQYQNPFT
jgi:hypothetical protein